MANKTDETMNADGKTYCYNCNGYGNRLDEDSPICRVCNGTGLLKDPCPDCHNMMKYGKGGKCFAHRKEGENIGTE